MDIFVFLIRFILPRLPVFPQQYVPACEDEWEPSSGQTSGCHRSSLSPSSALLPQLGLSDRPYSWLSQDRLARFFLPPTCECVCVSLGSTRPCALRAVLNVLNQWWA